MELTRRSLITAAAAGVAAGGLHIVSAPAAEAVWVHPTLKLGMRGFEVVTLQRRLAALGYWCGGTTGRFGALTQQAVYALQKAAGLTRDGVVGPRTWQKLGAGVRPSVRSTSGTVIEVNKARQLLLVVQSGSLKLTLNTSTGSGQRYWDPASGTYQTAYTPSGWWSIYSRYTSGWQQGSLGAMYRPTYWHRGWAIHGSSSIPPYPASHGCCRLSTAGMDLLYSRGYVPVARRVYVY